MSTSPNRSRIIFMCVPRSTSTSVLKCLSFFDDSEVWFEPYVVCRVARIEYQLNTGRDLPPEHEGNEDMYKKAAECVEAIGGFPVKDARELSYSYAKHCLENSPKRIVLAKDMGMSIAGFHEYLPSAESGYKYVFLIRNPYRAVTSYKKAVVGFWKKVGQHKDKDESDFNLLTDDRLYPRAGGCFEDLHAVLQHVRANLDPDPLIIDTEDLLSNPKAYLEKICAVGGLEYHDGLLQWDSSADAVMKWRNSGMTQVMEDILSDFHGRALTCSCFHPSSGDTPARSSLAPDVLKAIDAGLEYYKEMYDQRYKP